MVSSNGVKMKTFVRCKKQSGLGIEDAKKIAKLQGNQITLYNPHPQSGDKEIVFNPDRSFSDETDNQTVFDDAAKPLIEKALLGYNVLVLGLGQRGTGKKHTFYGSIDNPGLVPQFGKQLFMSLEEKHKSNQSFLVTMSTFQVSDDGFCDILNPSDDDLTVKSHFKSGVYVSNLSEYVVTSFEELDKLFTEGRRTKDYLAKATNAAEQCSIVLRLVVHQKLEDGTSLTSEILLVIVSGSDQVSTRKSMTALNNLFSSSSGQPSIRASYASSNLTHALQNHLMGNSIAVLLATISLTDKDFQETSKVLQLLQKANNVTSQPIINKCDDDAIIAELRTDINNTREKIVSRGHGIIDVSDGQDLEKLRHLIKDLEHRKLQSWTEKQRLSKSFEAERWRNLADKGLLDFVLNPAKQDSQEVQKRLDQLQKDKDQVTIEYKDRRNIVDSLKKSLQELITEYSNLTESGKSGEEESKKKVPEIHKLKENLKLENEHLKKLKTQLKDIQEKQNMENQVLKSEMTLLNGKSDVKSRLEAERREQSIKDNRTALAEEIDRVKIETEQQKAELKLKYSQETQSSPDKMLQLEATILDLRAEKAAMALKIKIEQQEKHQLMEDLSSTMKRHDNEMEVQQLQHFQTFRHYREIFEEQKAALDQKYRTLLEDSIQDAVFLSSRNEELMEENRIHQQDLAEAKDELSTISAKK